MNRAILTGFSTLYQEIVEKEHLVPVTDPDFELLAVNRAEGFRAGAEFYCLPPLELERYTGFTQPIQPRPIRQVSIELEVNTRHGDEDRAADAAGKAALRRCGWKAEEGPACSSDGRCRCRSHRHPGLQRRR